ncbi:MAG: Crp/Fnr family transcriptional regulator [Sphingobacteriaceae bacterium]|nr:Crp/Fnr family transcriptional regulator [Cytophagaceae bacterium]
MEILLSFFSDAGFSEAERSQVGAVFTPTTYAKGTYFVEEGHTAQRLAFIEQGVFQYVVNRDGDEITTYVVGKGGFMASLLSFFKQVPARENIRALTEARTWEISKESLAGLLQMVPAFKDFYIGVLEWQIGCIDDSRLNLLTLSAEGRYEKLMREEPHLLQQIPLQYLASILGVTPRHLSRIRRTIR